MKKTLFTLLLFICFGSSSIFSQEKISQEYKKAVEQMLDASGSEDIYKTMIKGLVKIYKKQHTNVPEGFWDEFEQEFLNAAIIDLTTLLIPIYKKHLGINDLNEVTKFYHSPAGKRMVEKTPLIMQESMIVGEQWGKTIGKKFAKKT